MTENPGTSFRKKPVLYAMVRAALLPAPLEFGLSTRNRRQTRRPTQERLPVTIANITLNHVSLDTLKAVSPAAVTIIH